ncbi:thiamine pyrophosphate-binding protein [Paenibacillus eucommiae]|uniref:Acetolactate synthase-1/2/3 large subunit n=1 Tax=Paenibacillus eucommiae TaxID=1355755 RepID=A0ABS4IS48_9BACL|nr:thiamine pyrophosphate-binding protein [Paenibacillus eucommiae]MBP1990393.1 acetolactate synthase-1/2/3 large subunit [Paenibacillus eucommiae]
MRAIEIGLQLLVERGVRHIFGIPAGSINALYDTLLDMPELRPIVAKHETTAGYMATAYTRITGTPSVCVGSSGPGATNLISAAANAWKEKLPVLFITGSVPSTKLGKGGAQELAADPLFEPITKTSSLALDAESLPNLLAEALYTATSGVPGPVHIAIPINIQMTEIGNPSLPLWIKPRSIELDETALLKAMDLIAAAGPRGCLLLGHGAKSARSAVVRFAERTGWQVATTPRGKGVFPEDHPLSLGVYGLSGNTQAINKLNSNDHELLLVIGSSLGELATSNWESRLQESVKLIQVDIDVNEFGKTYIPDVAVRGDALMVLDRLLAGLPWQSSPSPEAAPVRKPLPIEADSEEWNTMTAIRQIGACAAPDTRFYIDIGEFMTYSIQNLCITADQRFDIDINFGAMGSGIGGVIGAKLADPTRPTVCITGDGCFFMHGFEVLTAKQYGLPIVFVIINNARLGMVYHGHMLQYKRCLDDFSQPRVDIAAAAACLGLRTVQVHSLANLQPHHMREWLSLQEPIIVEVIVDGNEVPPMGERVKFLEGATY